MKAVTWQGTEEVRVDDVADPRIETPTDAIVRVTSTAICGSDLHLYKVLSPFLDEGDIIGHEPMGIVEEVGADVHHIAPGDRVVVPFNISCGSCFMCDRALYAQCETTQVTEQNKGAQLFGYTRLYGSVPGGQAEYLRVPQAHFGPDQGARTRTRRRGICSCPTSCRRRGRPSNSRRSPMAARSPCSVSARSGSSALASPVTTAPGDRRRPRAGTARDGTTQRDRHDRRHVGRATSATSSGDLTDGRGPDSVIDAVGMEAHGSPTAALAQRLTGMLPDRIAAPLTEKAGVDRLASLLSSIDAVRRGGTVSVIGVYGGAKDPLPMMDMFDKGSSCGWARPMSSGGSTT